MLSSTSLLLIFFSFNFIGIELWSLQQQSLASNKIRVQSSPKFYQKQWPTSKCFEKECQAVVIAMMWASHKVFLIMVLDKRTEERMQINGHLSQVLHKAVGKQLMYENPTTTTEWERERGIKGEKQMTIPQSLLDLFFSLFLSLMPSLILWVAWHSSPVSSGVINILLGKDYNCHLYAIFTRYDWFKITIIVCLSFSVWLFCSFVRNKPESGELVCNTKTKNNITRYRTKRFPLRVLQWSLLPDKDRIPFARETGRSRNK